jgi:hypothetical protein
MQVEVRRQVRLPGAQEGPVNPLDPRAKRFRAADRSLRQARQALAGARLVLQDIPHANNSPLAGALVSIDATALKLDEAAALLDEARAEADDPCD